MAKNQNFSSTLNFKQLLLLNGCLHTSQEAHLVGAHPGFSIMKRHGVLDGML